MHITEDRVDNKIYGRRSHQTMAKMGEYHILVRFVYVVRDTLFCIVGKNVSKKNNQSSGNSTSIRYFNYPCPIEREWEVNVIREI
jgi:hypothetical protein